MKHHRRGFLQQVMLFPLGNVFAAITTNISSATLAYVELLPHEIEFPAMGSKINLRWYDNRNDSDPTILKEAKQIVDHWLMILSDYEPDSESSRVCNHADSGRWIQVSDDLWAMLVACQHWNQISQGAFDASLGALTRLRRQAKLAMEQRWTQARESCGWNLVELDSNNHAFRTHRAGVRFDFGAIGKGWIADRIAKRFRELGIEKFTVNASGNMRIGEAPPKVRGWPISVDVPVDQAEVAIEFSRFRMVDCGISTSGGRFQRFPDGASQNPSADSLVDRTSHIVDPMTKRGVSARHNVFVHAPNATDADAISTITSVRIENDLAGWLTTIESITPKLGILVLAQHEGVLKSIQIGFENESEFE